VLRGTTNAIAAGEMTFLNAEQHRQAIDLKQLKIHNNARHASIARTLICLDSYTRLHETKRPAGARLREDRVH
jgi:hypothetical protein